MNIQKLLAPKFSDIEYTQTEMLAISNILRMDSYKFAHPFAYPDGLSGMSCYGTARVSKNITIVPFGRQIHVKKYLTRRITMKDVDLAEAFAEKHFGRKLFARKSWEGVVNEHGGYLPLIIRSVKEGTPVPGGVPLYSVTAFGELYFWMPAAFETMIQRAEWYPDTVVSMDYDIKKSLYQFYVDTGADLSLLPFALHDFGGRGVTCGEQAEIGGAAHLVNFMGSDTIEGIIAANFYYKCDMAAYSVYATEHSVECSFGRSPEAELKYIRHQLKMAKQLGITIVSIVIDGYDTIRCTKAICSLKDEIIASGVKVVLRPDSGDMIVNVTQILHLLEATFGYTTNAKGFRKINYVGVIQGDGVDHLAIRTLLGHIMTYGWAADNVIFGSGGALLQKLNRDTFKFAQKASAIMIHNYEDQSTASWGDPEMMIDMWFGIAKDPITDQGKRSEEGVLTLVRDKITGEMRSFRLEQDFMPDNLEDMHQLVYYYGKLYNETTLDEVRARCAIC